MPVEFPEPTLLAQMKTAATPEDVAEMHMQRSTSLPF